MGARWGFPDATTFNRAFRAFDGLPPAEYRARHQAVTPRGLGNGQPPGQRA